MYMSMRSDRFARLHTHEQARKHFESIKPYTKGRNKGLVPFAERNRTWLMMRQDGEDYVVRLYRTDIIRFKPNGDIVIQQGGWNSPTTHEVIARILGTQIFQRHYVGWIVTKGGTYPLRKEGECVFRRGSVTDPNSYGTGLHYINPELPVVHVLKRKEYNAMRKKYKAFETHLMGMLKLRDYMRPTNEETASVLGKYYEPLKIEEMMAMIDDEERWYEATVMLLRLSCHGNWYNDHQIPIKESRVKKELKDILCTAYKDTVFTTKVVDTGAVVRDTNAKYFQ